MKIIKSIAQLRHWRRSISANRSIGFVPTMGALHDAHLSLVSKSRENNSITIVSIFVNPTQFGPKEDFAKYPRPFRKDVQLLKRQKVDVLFAPTKESMYTAAPLTEVVVLGLTNTLCGAPSARGPQHFIGVATIVAKLFNLVKPTNAYFGLKDYQQVRVIEQMAEDLNFDVRIVRCPTLREKDGLAKSSRNAYLSGEERKQAPRLYKSLQAGRKLLRSRPRMSPRVIIDKLKVFLAVHPAFKIDYIELVDPVTLKRMSTTRKPALLAAAVFLGRTRLIDNILIQ